MKVFLGVVAFLAAACGVGTVIPQGEAPVTYLEHYGTITGLLLIRSGLTDVYHAWWFVAAEGWLVLSTAACTWRRVRALPQPYRLDRRNAARTGLVLAHLGVLLILVTLTLRPYTHREAYVAVAEGAVANLSRLGYAFDLHVRRFTIDLYPDGTPRRYVSSVEVRENGRIVRRAQIAVNHPLRHRGVKVYQFDWGWLVQGTVRRGRAVRSFDLRSGDAVSLQDGTTLRLHFYPDFTLDAAGMPATRSLAPRRPRVFYVLEGNGRPLTMGLAAPGEGVSLPDGLLVIDGYRYFTGLEVKREPTLPATFAGFVLAAAGLGLYYGLHLTRPGTGREA
ncbi:MAG: cytochrome c biogenesis protein ResB [Bacillota bacterium]